MKKGIAFVLIAVMALQLLTGCSLGKAPDSPEGGGENGGKGGTVLKIGAAAKGYGEEYIKQLAVAYEEKTGVKTIIAKSSSDEAALRATLQAGPKNNDIDVYFDIWPKAMSALATVNYVEGYERIFAPLSDIYDEVPEGWGTDKTLKELVLPYSLKACTWGGEDADYGDGNQYFVNTATGMEGLVYNVDLFDKYGLKVPRTTNEFLALLEQMKTIKNGTYAKNAEGFDVYPYVYSGKANYSNYLGVVWWAQYDGVDIYNLALEGKDANGNYTADSLKSVGKLSAMTIISKLLNQKSGYTDPTNYSQSFTNAQLKFLDGQAFMMSTGDWVEREMSANFEEGSLNIAFMRMPVNSDIIRQCDSVTTEEQLIGTIAYIDGDTDARPSYLSDADLKRVSEARSVYCSEGNQHMVYIPVYSDMIEEAKDFIRFMMSKEGQEIMIEYCYGNISPLNVDITQMKGYDGLSTLQKSKYEMLTSAIGLSFVGNSYVHPMAYAGGVESFYNQPTFETAFGVVETSASYMTPKEIWEADYKRMSNVWSNIMKTAGVAN